jgi:UDP-N-acetylmuramyl pentapeptide phosphotransferase/UDP-N-acetylglucosamine-1-phosphate transferase
MNLYNLMDDMDEIAATQGAVIILGFGASACLLGLPLWQLIRVALIAALERFQVLSWSKTRLLLVAVPIGQLRWKY